MRKTGNREDDPVAQPRQILMQSAGLVAKTPRKRPERHDAHADFIADQDNMSGKRGQRVEQRRTFTHE